MAIELVDGFAGHPHISSEDLAALNKGTIGAKDCVFDYGDQFKCTMETANKAVIGTGAGMVGGLRFWSKSSTDLTVQSGSQGMKRNDLVVARYKKDSGTQIESVALEVVKGTPHASSPADPAVGADGMALWRIPIDGITPGAPVMVASVTPSIQALRDSVSHTIAAGATAVMIGGVVMLRVHDATVNLPDYWSSHTLGTLPAGWRPSQEVSAPLAMAELATTARLSVDSSGKVAVKNMSGTAKPGSRRVYGCLCYTAA